MLKHQQVRDALREAIRSGEFPPGSRLPSEREVAERFGVSYMTARRAVAGMVEENLLERRARSGTYVRAHSRQRLATSAVHLLCSVADNSLVRGFLRIGAAWIERRGGRANIVRFSSGGDHAAVHALQSGEPALVLTGGFGPKDPLADAMQRAAGRAALIGNRMDEAGVPSVLADDTHALRLAVTHLKERGHRAIALLCSHPAHPVTRVQIAAWRAGCGDAARDTRLIAVRSKPHDCLSTSAYDAVRAFLASDRAEGVTALISLIDEMTLAALAASRDAGRAVPERLALVSLGDSALLAFAHPPITSVDVDLDSHVERALEMVDAALAGTLAPEDRLRLVEPRLVIRQSVAPYLPNRT